MSQIFKKSNSVLPKQFDYWITSWRPYVIIAVVGLLVFGRTVFFGYTYFDDDNFILKSFDSISKPSTIISAFHNLYYSSYYRPLLTVSFVIDSLISGKAPWMYHASNVLFHLVMSCFVYRLLLKLKFTELIALSMSLIFTIHPLVTQSVAWIPGRNESIHGLFVLVSIISYLNYRSSGQNKYIYLHLLFILLALLIKETALIVPLLIISYTLIVERKWFIPKKPLKIVGGWIFVIVAWYVMREIAFSGSSTRSEIFTMSAFFLNLRVILEAFGKLFIPVNLSSYATFSAVPTMIGSVIVLFLFIYILVKFKSINRLIPFAISSIILFILPSLFVQIFDAENRFNYLEYRFYLPIVGFAIFLGSIFQDNLHRFGRMWKILLLIVLCSYGFLTFKYSGNYRDPISHWEHAIKMSPMSAEVYFNMGIVNTEIANNSDQAKENYVRAVELNDKNPKYHYNLGLIYLKQNQKDIALKEFERTIEINPTNIIAQYNLGNLYFMNNDLRKAERCWKNALNINSNFIYAEMRLIELYLKEGNLDRAKYYQDRLNKAGYQLQPTK
ncbi:MAG: tetratricopeptide repeat protein [Ignavibacteriales bacterium]|nr:tetratricopeptide repeat protein [Ignavibacteriales bacterium]